MSTSHKCVTHATVKHGLKTLVLSTIEHCLLHHATSCVSFRKVGHVKSTLATLAEEGPVARPFSNKTLADAEAHQQMMEIVSLPDRPWKWGNCWAKLLEAGLVLNADKTINLIGQGQPPSAITTDHRYRRFCQALSCRNGPVAC